MLLQLLSGSRRRWLKEKLMRKKLVSRNDYGKSNWSVNVLKLLNGKGKKRKMQDELLKKRHVLKPNG